MADTTSDRQAIPMEPRGHTPLPSSRRRLALGTLLVVGVGSTAAMVWRPPRGEPASKAGANDPLAPYAAYCTDVPAAARIDPSARADASFAVLVPAEAPRIPVLPDSAVHAISQGEAVEFVVTSPRAGAIAVHGLSELVVLQPGSAGLLRFRALYTGRFPLHFHGADDGSHFEIAALEIRSALTGRSGGVAAA